jgi:hypothetical protein
MTVLLLCLTKNNYRTYTDMQNVDGRIVVRISHVYTSCFHYNVRESGAGWNLPKPV